eukprot:32583-Prorocentrum_minimum.AAC.1
MKHTAKTKCTVITEHFSYGRRSFRRQVPRSGGDRLRGGDARAARGGDHSGHHLRSAARHCRRDRRLRALLLGRDGA